MQLKVNKFFKLDNSGGWLKKSAPSKVQINSIEFDSDSEELMVFFDPKVFDVSKYGLIYCDKEFLKSLKDYFKKIGYPSDIDYSEQGMQGKDYVSFDVGDSFLESVKAFF